MSVHDEIARTAYELYEKGGRTNGHDLYHWLEAEKILRDSHNGEKRSAHEGEVNTVKSGRIVFTKRAEGKDSSKTVKSKTRSESKRR